MPIKNSREHEEFWSRTNLHVSNIWVVKLTSLFLCLSNHMQSKGCFTRCLRTIYLHNASLIELRHVTIQYTGIDQNTVPSVSNILVYCETQRKLPICFGWRKQNINSYEFMWTLICRSMLQRKIETQVSQYDWNEESKMIQYNRLQQSQRTNQLHFSTHDHSIVG